MLKKEYEQKVQENYKNRFKKYKRFNRKKFNFFKEIFGTFRPNQLQDFYTFAQIIENNEIDLQDFIEFVIITKDIMKEQILIKEDFDKKQIEKELKKFEKNIKKCPKCDNPLLITPIKIPKGKNNKNGFKSHFFCDNPKCDYEEFSKEKYEKNNVFISKNENDLSDVIDPDMNNLFGININEIEKQKLKEK